MREAFETRTEAETGGTRTMLHPSQSILERERSTRVTIRRMMVRMMVT